MKKETMSYIYEDPPSLRIEDWEAFCEKMREEVALHPDRQDAIDTLSSSERFLRELRQEWAAIKSQAA
ncbi:hypothetical protein [uncultured Thiocystis sp.]|jgi:hypothetical protein|uniref:hypothetical protein n=1 Tax=uncultured Thiocystis sp. TaxID=1202134 RepID=UPI0025EFCA7B|nr:hypothetical protein [uncultured Thiocystis sp.]